MKNWLVPLSFLGLTGAALFCSSKRGRDRIRALLERVSRSDDPLLEFNRFLESRLEAIQRTLEELSDSLEEQRA